MRNLTHIAIALALWLGCADFKPVFSQTKPEIKKPASVAGRVTLKGKGKGGIAVGLRSADFGPQLPTNLSATTDPDGNYRILNIPAGSYEVLTMSGAYILADPGPLPSRGKKLVLAEGESVQDIDFSIVRGAVITGKITHADGRPAMEESVAVLDQTDQQGRSFWQSAQTDDRGIYRIFGLPHGKYKVAVGQAEDGGVGGVNRVRGMYERVFYPNVTDVAEAKVVDLSDGGEATNIDITIGDKIQGFSVTGSVVDGETGKPLPSVRFGIRKELAEPRSPVFSGGGMSGPNGDFRLENLTPGKYSIFLVSQTSGDWLADSGSFEVVDQDVTGVVVRTSKGAILSGVVVMEGVTDKAVLAKLSQLRLHVNVRSEEQTRDMNPISHSSLIGGDGSFRLSGLGAGIASFQLSNMDRTTLKGFSVSRIERDGVVQPHGIKVNAGEQISGLRIGVRYASAVVRGTVNFVNGEPPPNMRAVVRLTTPGGNAFILRPAEVDARGHFILEGVPAGTYDVVANAYVPNVRFTPPQVRQPITITDGSTAEVVLSIDLTPTQLNP